MSKLENFIALSQLTNWPPEAMFDFDFDLCVIGIERCDNSIEAYTQCRVAQKKRLTFEFPPIFF